MERITLRAGGAGVELAPEVGGAIARYWQEAGAATREWLRPASAAALAGRDPWRTAGFPLVPWSNRIREGRFAFGGRTVTLPLNFPPERHVIHGQGWEAAWRPVAVEGSGAELEYRHAPDAWPWAYRARQRIRLSPAGLAIELALTNESEAVMPAGLGWHPYFVRTPGMTLTADVAAMWLTDAETMPTVLAAVSPARDPGRGLRVDAVALDNCFTGWSGRAVLAWPEWDARVVLAADPPLRFLVVYTPPGRDFLCVEPVSHATDAVNLAAAGRSDTGFRTLGPGETLRAAVTLTPETT